MIRVAVLTKDKSRITVAYRIWVLPECKEKLRRDYGVDETWTETIEERPSAYGRECVAGKGVMETERPELPCWECGHRTTDAKCPNCGFDSAVQADGGWLIPPRFTPVVEAMVRGDK